MKLWNTVRPLGKYLKPERKKLLVAIILIILASLLNISYGYLQGRAVEAITQFDYQMFLLFLFIYLLVQIIGTQGFRKPSRLILAKIGLNVTEKMSYDVFEKTSCLPARAFEEKTSGELINRITSDSETVANVFNQLLTMLVDSFGTLLITIYVFYNSWIVGLEIVLYVILVYFITQYYMPKVRAYQKEIKQQNDTYISEVNACIGGIRETRALGIRQILNQNMGMILEQIFTKRKKQVTFQTKYSMVLNTVNALFEVGIFVTSGLLIYYHMANITFFIAMTWYVYRYMNVITMFSEFSSTYQSVVVALERMKEILNNQLYPDQQYGTKQVETITGMITFDHVFFGYEKQHLQLKDFSFTITPNQKVAIVGKSGQGKTTLFNLLLRYFDPQEGSIQIDGIPIADFDENSLRKHISIIRQDPFLFHKTILENFQIVKETITLAEVRELCRKANMDDYIMSLPNQYDTLIGEGGVNLSGGQKQRLAIARTLIKDSKIILFDEATSALDNTSQNYIKKTIDALAENHTIVIIAHRLSTIIDADQIYLVDGGTVVGVGTHQQLMFENQLYQDLYFGE